MKVAKILSMGSSVKNNTPKNIDDEIKKESEYKDPLLNWPLRGLSYSNELGTILSEITPIMGTLLWIPALMYFGADIYDKYKNNKTNYDPCYYRAGSQALFQATAGVILPTAIIHGGQKLISSSTVFSKKGLSLQSKEDALNFVSHFLDREQLKKYETNVPKIKKIFKTTYDTYLKDSKHIGVKNILKDTWNVIFGSRHPQHLSKKQIENLHEYTQSKIDDIYAIRTDLMKNTKPDKFSQKMMKKFEKSKPYFKEEYGEEFLSKASKAVIKDFIKKDISKIKMIKTLGGITAIVALFKPMDKFVETIVMHKFVNPRIEKLEKHRKQDIHPIFSNIQK